MALNRYQEAKADLEAVLAARPEDFTAADHLRYVNAKLAPPPAAAAPAAAPTATPTPPPTKLLTRTNIFIALGVLVVLGIIAALVGHKMITKPDY